MKKKNQKRIPCPYCTKDYANEDTLAIHIQNVHPEKIEKIDDAPEKETIEVVLKKEEQTTGTTISLEQAERESDEELKQIQERSLEPEHKDINKAFKPIQTKPVPFEESPYWEEILTRYLINGSLAKKHRGVVIQRYRDIMGDQSKDWTNCKYKNIHIMQTVLTNYKESKK